MLERRTSLGLALSLIVAGSAGFAACGGGENSTSSAGAAGQSGSAGSAAGGAGGMTGSGGDQGGTFDTTGGTAGQGQSFDVQPSALQTITVTAGQSTPTVTYTATLNGNPANAGWGLDKGNLGTIPPGPSSMATFTPSGKAGGTVTIQAGLNKMTVNRQVFIKLTATQNGADPNNPQEQPQIANDVPSLTAGGGIGGVGGEGLGGPVDMTTVGVLAMPSGDGSAEGLSFLYPYDKTVWPRGLLAPLLQWTSSLGDADAIQLQLATKSGSFTYTGTFAKPAILAQTGQPFTRHPIPQDVWDMATNSAGAGDDLTLSLTVALGGKSYGPISETWTIAPGRLTGTIYYNSYGTQLAKNYNGAVGGDHKFGAAVLSIHVGDTGPKLTAGSDTACRTCHSVAAFGSRLVATDNGPYYDYELSPNGAVEMVMPNSGSPFPGLYPDGSMMLTGDGQMLPLPNGGAAIPTQGLSTPVPRMPTFSGDGKRVAFNPGVGSTLRFMTFDLATMSFSNEAIAVDDTGTGLTPGWPAFFPDNQSVVFQQETQVGAQDGHGSGILWTRKGAKGYIAWTSVAGGGGPTPLDQLNGAGYLPKLAAPKPMSCTGDGYQEGGIDADHADDANLNYEPTVSPIASGGYAWVVFTSRRMYGSVATIPPFCSDPRGVDLVQNITTKKLWVAAIDLSGQPSMDASHPAFYLPAQELLAGNSRGFWVTDPCKPDGSSCSTGDQCCNGYCQPDANGNLTCSMMPPGGTCSQTGNKCETDSDCCDPTDVCINGFCTEKGPA